MKFVFATLCAAMVFTPFSTVPAHAQDADEQAMRVSVHLAMLSRGHSAQTPGPGMIDVVRDIYFRADVDNSGDVTAEDALLRERLAIMGRRKSAFSYWAAHDVDADGSVTIDEIRQTYMSEARGSLLGYGAAVESIDPAIIQKKLEERVENRLEGLYDLNGDGVFSFEELVTGANLEYPSDPVSVATRLRERSGGFGGQMWVMPLFDQNKDGAVSRDEFLAAYEPIIAAYDTDGDGSFSEDEAAPLKEKAGVYRKTLKEMPLQQWLQ